MMINVCTWTGYAWILETHRFVRASLQHSFHIGLGTKFAFHYPSDNIQSPYFVAFAPIAMEFPHHPTLSCAQRWIVPGPCDLPLFLLVVCSIYAI